MIVDNELECGRERVWNNSWYSPGISLKRLRKSTKRHLLEETEEKHESPQFFCSRSADLDLNLQNTKQGH
jgi:hypothetical protein